MEVARFRLRHQCGLADEQAFSVHCALTLVLPYLSRCGTAEGIVMLSSYYCDSSRKGTLGFVIRRITVRYICSSITSYATACTKWGGLSWFWIAYSSKSSSSGLRLGHSCLVAVTRQRLDAQCRRGLQRQSRTRRVSSAIVRVVRWDS